MERTIKHVDAATANAMLEEARINMAWLQRFSGDLAACNEGRVFINLLAQTAQDALLFALNHFPDPTKGAVR